MGNHKDSWQETDEGGARIQGALGRHVAAQKRIRKRTRTATEV